MPNGTKSARFATSTIERLEELACDNTFQREFRALAEGDGMCPAPETLRTIAATEVRLRTWLRTNGNGKICAPRFKCLIAYVESKTSPATSYWRWRTLGALVDGLDVDAASLGGTTPRAAAKQILDAHLCRAAAGGGTVRAVKSNGGDASWRRAVVDFEALVEARRTASRQLDEMALTFALKYGLPLDIVCLRVLSVDFSEEEPDDTKTWFTESLGFELFVRGDALDVPSRAQHRFDVALCRMEGAASGARSKSTGAPYSIDTVVEARSNAAKHADVPNGYVASPEGIFPLKWVPRGKRAYTRAPVDSADADANASTAWRDALHAEVERGTGSCVLPDEILRRVATTAVDVARRQPDVFDDMVQDWRVLRFNRAPSDSELRAWRDSIRAKNPAWQLLEFVDAMTRISNWEPDRDAAYRERAVRLGRNADFALYVPVYLPSRSSRSAGIAQRDLIEPHAPSISRWFEARKDRAFSGE